MSTASATHTALAVPSRVTVGHVILAIAALHTLVGLVIGLGFDPRLHFEGSPPLTAMWNEGLVASVGQDPWRRSVTWFLLFGGVLALVGWLAHEMERAGITLTRMFGVALGAFCLFGALLMPVSGFWLGIVPVGLILRRATR